MATGNEKRLPVLQAIVSTSVNAKFASCGEREANAVFISPGSVLHRLEGCLYLRGLACIFHHRAHEWLYDYETFMLLSESHYLQYSWACSPVLLWAHGADAHFSLPYNITSSLLITLLLFFSHSQIDPKVAFPRRAQPKVRINWSLTLLKENDYVSRQQLT